MNCLLMVNLLSIEESFSTWQLLYSFIGAFAGFGLTLLIEVIVSTIKNHRTRKYFLQCFSIELKSVLNKTDIAITDQAIIEVPTWETFVNSGSLLLFHKKKYFQSLISTYTTVKELAALEKETQVDSQTMEMLKQKRKETKNKIETLFNEIKVKVDEQ